MTIPSASRLFSVSLIGAILAPVPLPGRQGPRIAGTEQVRVEIVLIDLVAQDRDERPIRGLTPEDLEIRIDTAVVGPDRFAGFEEICDVGTPATNQPDPEAASSGIAPDPGGPSSPPFSGPRHIILFFDFSSLSIPGRTASLAAARDFISGKQGKGEKLAKSGMMKAGDRIMILVRGRRLRVLQEFTDSGILLADAIEGLRNDRTDVASAVLEEAGDISTIAALDCGTSPTMDCPRREHIAMEYAIREQRRTLATLEDLERLMPAFGAIRGRKALVLFTDALRRAPGAQYLALARRTPEGEGIRIDDEILRLTREANAAGVSIYTVHASGLEDPSVAQFRDALNTMTVAPAPRSTGSTHRVIDESLTAAQTGLDSALALQTTLALETGGRAIQRTNDVGWVIGSAREDLSCYYMIGLSHEGRGDGRRHPIRIALTRAAERRLGRGAALRYRPYFTDRSERDVRERLLTSALRLPALYRSLALRTEAFALAPEEGGRRVLIKTSLPIDSLPPLHADRAAKKGRFVARGEAVQEGTPVWTFDHTFDFDIERDAGVHTLVLETGGILRPGDYDLSVVLLDSATGDAGAERTRLRIPDAAIGGPWVSEVQLWVRDSEVLLVTEGVEPVGLEDGRVIGGHVPRSERRISKTQSGLLSFLLCLPPHAVPGPGRPILVERSLRGEGNAVVAGFRPLEISEAPDARTGCYQFINAIPTDTLGEGVYTFEARIHGNVPGGLLTREAAFVVE